MSVDIDPNALHVLRDNISVLDLDHIIFPICTDIHSLDISELNFTKNLKITTIMNPPFGVQTRSADRIFLEKAFSFSDVVYSIHLSGEKTRKFIKSYIEKSYDE